MSGLFSKKKLEFELVTTRGGDKGESFTYDGSKKVKYDSIFNAVGDLDELNSFLGVVRNLPIHNASYIAEIQEKILNLSSQVATDPNSELYSQFNHIEEKDIDKLEQWQNKLMHDAFIPQKFILPGEKKDYTAHIDIARSVCRRCERQIVKLIRDNTRIDLFDCQRYLNRLSDFLFVFARYEDTIK